MRDAIVSEQHVPAFRSSPLNDRPLRHGGQAGLARIAEADCDHVVTSAELGQRRFPDVVGMRRDEIGDYDHHPALAHHPAGVAKGAA